MRSYLATKRLHGLWGAIVSVPSAVKMPTTRHSQSYLHRCHTGGPQSSKKAYECWMQSQAIPRQCSGGRTPTLEHAIPIIVTSLLYTFHFPLYGDASCVSASSA